MGPVSHYPQPQYPGAWGPPPGMVPYQRPPSGVTAIVAGAAALALIGFTVWPIINLIRPLVGSCGESCFAGLLAVELVGLGLADLLLLVGAILLFARKVTGAVLAALGAIIVLTVLLMAVIQFPVVNVFLVGTAMSALTTLVLSMLPPTFAWLRFRPQRGGFPAQPAYPQPAYPQPGYPPRPYGR